MGEARLEIEIKLRFASPAEARQRIDALGAVEIEPRQLEDNRLYDRPDGSLRADGRALRLRRFGSRALLTLKQRGAGGTRHKVREERETAVADATTMDAILRGLGFVPRWRYQKHRTVFALDALHVCLDETALGCFVELEGAPEAIDRAAARLGYGPAHYVRESYRELAERAAGGGEVQDLLVNEGGHA